MFKISIEFAVSIIIQVISVGIFVGGSIVWQKFVEKWLTRIEDKQDKYNNYLERLVKCEQATCSSHHRLDEIIIKLNHLKED